MRQPRKNRLTETRLAQRVRPASPAKRSHWWSEPPKLIPIVISLIAVTISCLSWWESHRGRRINEEINRPILSLVSVEITSNDDYVNVEEGALHFYVHAKIKNSGKSTALIKRAKVNPELLAYTSDICIPVNPNKTIAFIPDVIFPGTEAEFGIQFQLSPGCLKLETWDWSIRAEVDYFDKGSETGFSQELVRYCSIPASAAKNKGAECLETPMATPSPTMTPIIGPTPSSSPK